MVLLGAHESTAGGVHKAFDRIMTVGGESLQIFTRNQRQWKAASLQPQEIQLFRQAWEECQWMPVASHASYLINLGTCKQEMAQKSVRAFVEELRRCQALGIDFVVIHPGSHGGAGVERGLAQVVRNLDHALEDSRCLESGLKVLLETTAGQGTSLGSSFEELGWIITNCKYRECLGVCVDTCHVFAAGYDLRSVEDYEYTITLLDKCVGLDKIHFFHLNDSKKECGSRVDRHEHIGEGCIGLQGFRNVLLDKRFEQLPMTLETPKSKALAEDRENLSRLRSLVS